jgi:hypothetical protein
LTAPRGITQPPTSFIGSQCQGIHHAPLNTYNTKQLNNSRKNQKLHYHRTQNNTNPQKEAGAPCMRDARNHYPQIKHHTPPPKQGNNNQPRNVSEARSPPNGGNRNLSPVSHTTGRRDSGPVVSKPNSVSDGFLTAKSSPKTESRCGSTFVVHQTPTHYRRKAISRIAWLTEPPHNVGGTRSRGAP